MNKNFLNSLYFLIAFLFATLSSCGGGDNEDGGGSGLSEKLQSYKWIYRNSDFTAGDDYLTYDTESIILFFTSDTEGIASYVRKVHDTDFGSSLDMLGMPFTYQISGNSVTVLAENGNRGSFVYSSGILVHKGSMEFIPDGITSSDYEWLHEKNSNKGKCGNDVSWKYIDYDKKLILSGNGDMYDYSVGSQPWKDCYIEKVEVGEGITSIGKNAFKGISHVTEVNLPATLKEINDYAFSGSLLSEIFIPNSVLKIGEEAFSGCKYMKKLHLYSSSQLEYIGRAAFLETPIEMYSFEFPKNLKEIGDWAFMNAKIKNIKINAGFKKIGHSVFSGLNCDVILPHSVEYIGSVAFEGNISRIVIGTGCKTMYCGSFSSTSKYGKLYMNLSTPPLLEGLNGSIICEGDENWTLYVPYGCKSNYSSKSPWKYFKYIYEDSSLSGGESGGNDNGNSDDGNNDGGNSDKYTGVISGHEYVDLGLPSGIKWATCNVGASTPEQCGDYYCWGRTESRWDTPSYNKRVKISGTSQDVAHEKWGYKWSIPTQEQCQELLDNCAFKRCNINGKRVIKVTSNKNNQSIIFPLTGYYKGFYECGDTPFNVEELGKAGYYTIGERSTSQDGEPVSYYLYLYNENNNTCNQSYFVLNEHIYSYNYKLVVRPVAY